MSNKMFLKPKNPFLLLSQDVDGEVNYSWLGSEEELQEVAKELLEYGNKVINAIEIGSSRDIIIKKLYDAGDFIEEINSAYETAKNNGLDSIILIVATDCEMEYSINDTENGFQCDEFDCYFDDLDQIAEELFCRLCGDVTEIRIE
jgi:hypothetical protein